MPPTKEAAILKLKSSLSIRKMKTMLKSPIMRTLEFRTTMKRMPKKPTMQAARYSLSPLEEKMAITLVLKCQRMLKIITSKMYTKIEEAIMSLFKVTAQRSNSLIGFFRMMNTMKQHIRMTEIAREIYKNIVPAKSEASSSKICISERLLFQMHLIWSRCHLCSGSAVCKEQKS